MLFGAASSASAFSTVSKSHRWPHGKCYLIAFGNTNRVAEIPVNVRTTTQGAAGRQMRPRRLRGTTLEPPTSKRVPSSPVRID